METLKKTNTSHRWLINEWKTSKNKNIDCMAMRYKGLKVEYLKTLLMREQKLEP